MREYVAVGKFSSPESTFCADLFQYPFRSCVTAVQKQKQNKNPGHSAKSECGRLQLNAHPNVCGFAWSNVVDWCMVVCCAQNVRRDGSSFTCHQPCQIPKFNYSAVSRLHHLRRIFRKRDQRLHSSIQNHMRQKRSGSAREQRIALYKSNQFSSLSAGGSGHASETDVNPD